MPLLSEYARKKRIEYSMKDIPKDARILEVGCGNGWFGHYLKENGWTNYTGLDIVPPADVIGDIRNWPALGIRAESFDVILAFEVIEHVDCLLPIYDLLKPDGLMMLTSPVPHFDWVCRVLEALGCNQKRTSPHNNLIYFHTIRLFEVVELKKIGFLMQWGKFRKTVL